MPPGSSAVDRHRVAEDVHVAVLLRQAFRERLPLVPAGPAAVDAELAVGRDVLGVALDRHDVDRLRLVRVDGDREAEVGGQVPAHLLPGVAAVVAPHHVPVLLHEQRVGPRRVHRDPVDAMADLAVLEFQYVTLIGHCVRRIRNETVAARSVLHAEALARSAERQRRRLQWRKSAGICHPTSVFRSRATRTSPKPFTSCRSRATPTRSARRQTPRLPQQDRREPMGSVDERLAAKATAT